MCLGTSNGEIAQVRGDYWLVPLPGRGPSVKRALEIGINNLIKLKKRVKLPFSFSYPFHFLSGM